MAAAARQGQDPTEDPRYLLITTFSALCLPASAKAIGRHHVGQREVMGAEQAGRDLPGPDQLQQHGHGGPIDQAGRGRDVLDPQIVQMGRWAAGIALLSS